MATFIEKKGLFAPEAEKLWASDLGLVDWQDSVVFTKESLVNWLRTLEITVSQNGHELRKLPKYAKFGQLVSESNGNDTNNQLPTPPPSSSKSIPTHSVVVDPSGNPFIPTRKVRELPGGGSAGITSIFGADDDANDAQDNTPSKPSSKDTTHASAAQDQTPEQAQPSAAVVYDSEGKVFVPSRKVRQLPGGGSAQIRNLFGWED